MSDTETDTGTRAKAEPGTEAETKTKIGNQTVRGGTREGTAQTRDHEQAHTQRHHVDHGEWALFAALVLAGTGLFLGVRVLVAAATIPLCYVGAAVFRTRQEPSVRVHRAFNTGDSAETSDGVPTGAEGAPPEAATEHHAAPQVGTDGGVAVATERDAADTTLSGGPGDTVTVRTTVENTGDASLVDLRIVDSVPDALPVVDGTPRLATTLEPGATATLEYDVELRRGDHEFEAAAMRARDLTGTVTETRTEPVDGATRVRCWPTVEEMPVTSGVDEYAGDVPTTESGSGIEFHSIREYAAGDPARSIDWRRYGRTRELATVEYRAERSTRVVCVVDNRTSQRRAATVSTLSAAELSASAAERASESLLDAGYPTGLVTLHVRRVCGVSPGAGTETRRQITEHLQHVRTQKTSESDWLQSVFGSPVECLPRVLPGEAQMVFFSSFVDDGALAIVKRLRTMGYAVRVVSPNVVGSTRSARSTRGTQGTQSETENNRADDSPETKRDTGARLEALDRDARLAKARANGARVIDWELERPIGLVLQEALTEVQPR
ncbi:hypothetical protein C483_12778 [Natrialba hulunbeirensis JCM 10989]|uniref:DUF58 domain-containing protein n=1 Tax=Natrialba hulunbeirensis JCM 10989 TaxID=1227493 RepID=L9ZWE1_9EURY|nr:DUF58 domain-containing protein [Natrialba hulunbeirensis]ELY90386.1 hypothetical protein C483_12778 [Natrialba hulunbeirensis JCM 10989]